MMQTKIKKFKMKNVVFFLLPFSILLLEIDVFGKGDVISTTDVFSSRLLLLTKPSLLDILNMCNLV